MKKSVDISSKLKGYENLRRWIFLSLTLVLVFIVCVLGYMLMFYTKPCDSNTCFETAMKECTRVTFIREDDKARWMYDIIGNVKGENCKIEITLLKLNDGTIDIQKVEGKSMVCIVPKIETRYPEKDVTKCTGSLKEELQDIIIQRMHNYLIKNLGDVREGFGLN